jgi:hypothetical protein
MTYFRPLTAVFFISICFGALLWVQSQLIFQINLGNLPENGIYRSNADALSYAQRQLLENQLEEARSAVGQAPVSQALLNTYFVFNSELGNFDLKDRSNFLKHIGRYGWRHTAYLQNQILNEIERTDLESIILVADALLRRGKLMDSSFALLFLAEKDEAARSLLIERLNSEPDWRNHFFGSTDNLSKPEQLNARVLTLETMLANHYSVSRKEIAPAVVALIKSGQFGAAYKVGELTTSQEQKPQDRRNNKVGLANFTDSTLPMPSEWSARKGNGYTTRLMKGNDRYYFNIEWNGRGRPVLLQRMIRLEKKQYTVAIIGEISSKAVEISLICPKNGSHTLNFVPSASGPKKHIFETQTSPSCTFGYLRLTGRGAFGTEQQSLRIDDIEIK